MPPLEPLRFSSLPHTATLRVGYAGIGVRALIRGPGPGGYRAVSIILGVSCRSLFAAQWSLTAKLRMVLRFPMAPHCYVRCTWGPRTHGSWIGTQRHEYILGGSPHGQSDEFMLPFAVH